MDEQRLNGYYVACRTLKESSAKLSAKPESLYRRAESARRNVFRVRLPEWGSNFVPCFDSENLSENLIIRDILF